MLIFDSTLRKSTPPARRFGAGLLASRPTYRADYTVADEAWLISQHAAAESRHFDRLAAESAAMDRLEAGLLA